MLTHGRIVRQGPSGEVPIIRPISDGDAPALQDFYNTLDAPARELFRPLGRSALLEDCEAVVRNALAGRRYDLVVEWCSTICGWAFVKELDDEYASFGVGISEWLRGRGYGAKLTEGVIEFARRSGCRGVDLTVVRTNERAQRLYERFGFVKTGDFDGSDGLPYYRMRLEFGYAVD